MITPDGDVKLLDMGLARALDDETGLTRANTVLGTLDYASPEQLRDAAKADVRSDLYSVGCTLYFALAGQAPFEGGDMINKIFKQRMEDPEPLENVARTCPAAFAAVVRKLMSKKPEERYQDCAELRGDLARWTDPARVRAILGAEADAARSFRPPPPELVEEDLRLLDRDDPASRDGLSLRDLGGAEPSTAPRHQAPMPPLPAIIRSVPQPRHVQPAGRDSELRRRLALARPVRHHRRRRRLDRHRLHRHLSPLLNRMARYLLSRWTRRVTPTCLLDPARPISS